MNDTMTKFFPFHLVEDNDVVDVDVVELAPALLPCPHLAAEQGVHQVTRLGSNIKVFTTCTPGCSILTLFPGNGTYMYMTLDRNS